jgi:hypothetical protein
MLDWLAVWGAGQATAIVFRPILEDLARDVAKDAAKSSVARCFKKVFSVIHKEPLTKATGLALKELLELVENELIRAGIENEELHDWTGDVRRFIEHGDVRQAIASSFLDPDYHLDPGTFATAWQQLSGAHALTGLIEDYLHDELRFDRARAVSRALVRQLRERNFILCYLGADSYAFVHRTFLEYFCAADIVYRFNVARTLSEEGLIALFDEHCRDGDWHEVLRLICGQIDEQFVGRIIEHLTARADIGEWDGCTPLPELPLAIGCLAEVRGGGQLADVGAKLLKGAVRCFLRGRQPPLSFLLDLVNAAAEVGKRWPGKSAFQFSGQYPVDAVYPLHRTRAQFLAAVFQRRCWIEGLAACESELVRIGAIETLTENWPDENTRKLLEQRSVQDEDGGPRGAALEALADKWPDDDTRELLAQYALQDPDEQTRGAAFSALGRMHSEFGRILTTQDVDGMIPYLDPLEPISREHTERAAERADIAPDEVDAEVASLSDHLGWDFTRGAKSS